MIETELKITVDEATIAALPRNSALDELRAAPRKTQNLVSIYYETADFALVSAGIALRLRKVGRKWVQTVKRKSGAGETHGLFSNLEVERDAPGGRLVLDGPDEQGVYAAIFEAVGDAPLEPVFETRVRRITDLLRAPSGEVELAIDRGEIVAGDKTAPIREVEMELLSGDVRALFEVARRLFASGPLNFSIANKSARGYGLVRTGDADVGLRPRNAGKLKYGAGSPVERVARDVFRDCFAQISQNMVVVAETELPEGPHQLRVGLRRLRTAFAVFAPSLGETAIASLSDAARDLGQVVGGLRDLDVLIDEVVAEATAHGLDKKARAALVNELNRRRKAKRAEVRAVLAAPETIGFVFDLAQLIEGRGWLAPSDYSQTERLARPLGEIAPGLLRKRTAKSRRKAQGLRHLDTEELHDLRKELKKLRYTADILDPIYTDKRVASYIKSLKQMQDTFGSLNDATMAHDYLTGPDAPGQSSPDIQRAIGWVLGILSVKVPRDRPKLFKRWEDFEDAKPFWKGS